MNYFTFKHNLFNNGEEYKLTTPLNEEQFKEQFSEIFEQEQYKEGKYKEDMVIVDVGANMGLSALYFKDVAKKIYALEPSKQHFDALVENVKGFDNIIPLNIGLAARSAPDNLLSNDSGTVPESFFGNGEIAEQVELLTFGDFLTKYEIEHVDLLKVDAEGAEYVIFPSPSFKDNAQKVDRIIGESHLINNLFPQFIPLILKDCGFETTFLPKDNLFKEMRFTDIDSNTSKSWTVFFQTLFTAQRI